MLYFGKYRFGLILMLLIWCSCKKDLLHWQAAQKLETHTSTDRWNKILFIDDSTGFIIGGERFSNAAMLMTADGGASWAYRSFPDAGKGLYGITFVPPADLGVIGFDGTLLRSADKGANWSFTQMIYNPFKDIFFINADHGLLIGGISYHSGFIEHFRKDGSVLRRDSTAYELNDLEMIDPASGYLCGFGIVLKTKDSCATWQQQDIKNDNFTAIHAYGASVAWTCGYNGSIFRTADGGNSWERMRNGNDLTIPHYRLLDILFTDAQNGYAVGEDGLVIYTDDGGRHWMEFDRFTDNTLRCIVSLKDGSLLVCGDHGSLFKILKK